MQNKDDEITLAQLTKAMTELTAGINALTGMADWRAKKTKEGIIRAAGYLSSVMTRIREKESEGAENGQ